MLVNYIHIYFPLLITVFLIHLPISHAGVSISAAAAGGVHSLGAGTLGEGTRPRNPEAEEMVMWIMAGTVGGIVFCGILHLVWENVVKKYCIKQKIGDIKLTPSQMEKLKCKLDHSLKPFQIPPSISSFITCSSKTACSGNGNVVQGQTDNVCWFHCATCSYRVCSSCVMNSQGLA